MGPTTVAVGFDVGSFNCCVATVHGRVVDAVGDEYDKRQIPAFVLFDDYIQYIGRDAKANQDINYENTIFDFKQFLGKSPPEIESMNPKYPYKLLGNARIAVKFGGKPYELLPQQLLAMLLKKLKAVADANTGQPTQSFVLNVPIFFNENQRKALYDSVRIAKLNCSELLEDTTAIALNYAHTNRHLPDKRDQYVTVAFVTVGYSCTQVAICRMNKHQAFICAQSWDPNLGGRDFDMVIYKYLERKHPFLKNADPVTRVKVLQECEEVKKRMGLHKKPVEILVESLPAGESVQAKMDRAIFEHECEYLLNRFKNTLEQCRSKSTFSVDVVELVGGGVRVPAIRESVQWVFGKAGQMTMNGDEAVASGCALRAAAIQSPNDIKVCKIMVRKDTEEQQEPYVDPRSLSAYQDEFDKWITQSNEEQHKLQHQQMPPLSKNRNDRNEFENLKTDSNRNQQSIPIQYSNRNRNTSNEFGSLNTEYQQQQQQPYPVRTPYSNTNHIPSPHTNQQDPVNRRSDAEEQHLTVSQLPCVYPNLRVRLLTLLYRTMVLNRGRPVCFFMDY